MDKLKSHPISAKIDFFGGGNNSVDDKWDAIAPYKYHLVMENSVVPDYWSEKLADSYLGFAFPVYYGCPNIHDYFSSDALRVINIENFDMAVALLEGLLANDIYEKHLPAIIVARNKILNDYNIFQLIAHICDSPAERLVHCHVKPLTSFVMPNAATPILLRIARKVLNVLNGFKIK